MSDLQCLEHGQSVIVEGLSSERAICLKDVSSERGCKPGLQRKTNEGHAWLGETVVEAGGPHVVEQWCSVPVAVPARSILSPSGAAQDGVRGEGSFGERMKRI